MTDPTGEPRPHGPEYRGAELDAQRGPGLGCFRLQVAVLALFVVLTPLGVAAHWPIEVTGALLVITIVLLFFVGQTVIFLLRIVAADRRTRRRPLASPTPTVGELEDQAARVSAEGSGPPEGDAPGSGASSVRQ